jgi:hypothetical protein
MEPCLAGVRAHLADFVAGLHTDDQRHWDLRFDYVAHSSSENIFRMESLYTRNMGLCEALYGGKQGGRLFTSDPEELKRGLNQLSTGGDEAPLVALDCCLDFPWRPPGQCHRVVILMTDEPFEQGSAIAEQRAGLPQLVDKVQALRVMLFLVAPESEVFNQIGSIDRATYEAVARQGDGLAQIDFGRVLSGIGRSVSVSSLQQTKLPAVQRGLFGQAAWKTTAVRRWDGV